MAMKKYRFFAGACGPHIMYSNIIKAEDEIAAAKIYLTEVIVMDKRPERTGEELSDASRYPIQEGDLIAYMKPVAYNRCDGFLT